jgi:hypothetical protein
MMAMSATVELFVSPYCRCSTETRDRIRDIVRESMPEAAWSEIDVLDELERSVSRGIRTTPAIAVNGRVVTSGNLDLDALRKALELNHDS